MYYSFPYNHNLRDVAMNPAINLHIEFKENYTALKNWLEAFKDKQEVVVYVNQPFDHKFFKSYKNVVFEVPYDNRTLIEEGEDFFFADVARSYDEFLDFVGVGAKQVKISGDIFFDLPKLRQLADIYNVKLRAYPNVVQRSNNLYYAMYSPFILPQMIPAYESYIDVFDMYVHQNDTKDIDMLYQAYVINKYWKDDIGSLVTGFREKIKGKHLPATYIAEKRTRCNRICLTDRGRCWICNNAMVLSDQFKDKGYSIGKED